MRQITLAATLILLSVPALSQPTAAPVAAPASLIEVRLPSPLVDMHFWARKLASSGGEVPALPGLAAAVETLRELDAQLGRPSLPLAPVWGAVDLHAIRAGTAAEFRQAVAALPETLTLPGGLTVPRAGIVRLAEAYAVLEKPFLEQVWPWHRKMIEHASATLEQDLLPHTGEIYADIQRSLGFPVPAQPIPLQLVAEAPHPGGVTYVAEVGRGLCLVAVDTPAGSLWLESVIHESIHALDLTGESALDTLRQRLGTTVDPPLPAREAWDVSHAVMFAQAAGTVRRVLAPRHRDYGEASGVYQRLPKGAEVASAWQAWMRGEITREAAIERIVDGFRTKEKGDPKAAPVPPTNGRPR
jgi:hypothetical protein